MDRRLFLSDLFDDDMNHGWFNITGTRSFLPEKRGGHFFWFITFCWCKFLKPVVMKIINNLLPQNLTWTLKMMVSKRNHLFQGLLFRFHVKFQGCRADLFLDDIFHR